MDPTTIKQLMAALFLASARAGGKEWVEAANGVLNEIAVDDATDFEAAHILQLLAKHAKSVNDADSKQLN